MTLSEALIQLRALRGLTGAELGSKIGVSAATVSYWETGQHAIRPVHRAKLLNFARKSKAPKDVVAAIRGEDAAEVRA